MNSRTTSRWVMAALWAVVLVVALTTGSTSVAVLAACLCALWAWLATRPPRPPVPAHVDEQWARRVLAAAGDPQGVPAVKALRDAEPALSLLAAKELADRARA